MSGFTRRFLIVVHLTLATALAVWCVPQLTHRHRPSSERIKPAYRLRTLALPGYKNSTATAVNARGDVVGYSWDEDRYSKAQPWVWKSGKFHCLPLPRNSESAYPVAINRHGVVVGTGRRTDKYSIGILWRNERATVFDRSADDVNVVFKSVNDREQIVGTEFRNEPYSDSEAIVWEGDKETLLGLWISADINEEGVTTGTHFDGSFVDWSHALTCEPGKEPRYFGIPDSYDFAYANAINSKRQVVGEVDRFDDMYDTYATLWHNDEITVLTKIPSCALDINDAGQVVGYLKPRPEETTAFMWQSGELIKLQDKLPEGTHCALTSASSISASGVIVGAGRQDGKWIGFALTPQTK